MTGLTLTTATTAFVGHRRGVTQGLETYGGRSPFLVSKQPTTGIRSKTTLQKTPSNSGQLRGTHRDGPARKETQAVSPPKGTLKKLGASCWHIQRCLFTEESTLHPALPKQGKNGVKTKQTNEQATLTTKQFSGAALNADKPFVLLQQVTEVSGFPVSPLHQTESNPPDCHSNPRRKKLQGCPTRDPKWHFRRPSRKPGHTDTPRVLPST